MLGMEREQDDRPKTRKAHPLILILLWIVFNLLVVVVGLPRVRNAIQQSGVLELLATGQDRQDPSTFRRVQVCFVQWPDRYSLFTVDQKRKDGSIYHDTFEALLAGPNERILEAGAVSFIHPDTQLRGVTLSSRILFVDFSNEYLLSSDLEAARQQVKRTALGSNRIKDVVILVEGKPLM